MSMFKWLLPAVAAVGLMLTVTAVKAAEAAAEQYTITGTVVDQDDKPVAEARVMLTKPRAPRNAPAQLAQAPGGRPEPLATATTNEKGEFTLTVEKAKLPDGKYNIVAFVREKGMARVEIEAKEGKVAPDKDVKLKLQPMQRRGGGAGGQ